jgi:acyl carrier protein
MDALNMNAKLVSCFQVVFPHLPAPGIPAANQDSVDAWDSVTGLTLLNVVEDEFRVTVDLERLPELTSFPAILAYLQELQANA